MNQYDAPVNPDISIEAVKAYVTEALPHMKTADIDIKDIVFEQRNELLCFYCARYNAKWTCPPRIPKADYKAIFKEYQHALFLYHDQLINDDYEKSRTDSSVLLHRALLDVEAFLLKNGNAVRLSFIGGSCKLCKNGCTPDKCANPYLARIPLEATGVNIIKSAETAGVPIVFPATSFIRRIGIILW